MKPPYDMRQDDAFFRSLIENASDVVAIVDGEGTLLYTSPATERILGYPAGALVGRSLFGLLHDHDVAGLRGAMSEAIEITPHPRTLLCRIRHQDGSWRTIESISKGFRQDDGTPAIMVNARDITARKHAEDRLAVQLIERKRAEESLSEKTAELEAILRALPDLFFRLDEETRFLDYAGTLSDLYVPPAEFLGKQVREVLPPQVTAVVEQAIAETHRTRRLATAEFELDIADSPQRFEGRFVSFLEGQTIALCRNITDRRRAENALRESEDRLRESQKMEAVGRLAGGIAHDFNNLLMAILGYSNMLIGRLGEDHPLTHELDEIRRAGERAAALTKQLLAFSRRQVVKPAVLDLGAIVTEMETMLGRVIGEHITVETSLAADLGRVRADRSQIEQVLMNLALNARDAMPNGGRLAIRLDNVVGGADGHADAASRVELTVTDTGCGMDAETQSHIFEPFFTTKRHGRGTGLGLSTVYGIVQQSGGTIRVASAPGHGSTFVLSFPSVDEPVDVVPPVSPSSMPRGRETILVVEDEDAVRSLVVQVLLRLGYRVMEAANAADAFDRLLHHEGRLELLVTDVVMPGASGRELAGKLVILYPACRVLYISGYAEGTLLEVGSSGPARDLLQKPFTPEALANRVRELLDRASPTP